MHTKRTFVVLGKNRFVRNEIYLDDAHNRVEYELDDETYWQRRKRTSLKQRLVMISLFLRILIWFSKH